MEKLFQSDRLSKRERVERALNLREVDRVPIHEQLSNSPRVVGHFSNRDIRDFDYTALDIGNAVKACLDCTFPLRAPIGTGIKTTEDGFQYKLDNWTQWHVSRPFSDEDGAAAWLGERIAKLKEETAAFDPHAARARYRRYMLDMQALVGETVILDFSITTGFCDAYDKMGLEIFSYFIYAYEELFEEYMALSGGLAAKHAMAVADRDLSPVVLIAEDFCTKQGSIFSPHILNHYHYPWVKALTQAWKSHGLKVIYHTDGNFKKVIPELLGCGVDGFYCLERNCGMHIEQLAAEYPSTVWMGGVDGVNVMEFGTTEIVQKEVEQIIRETNAMQRGGIFIGTSSEMNPPIPLANFLAMLGACDTLRTER